MAMNFASHVARNAHDRNKDHAQRPVFSSLFEVIPTGRALGAEVWNVDIRSFDDWSFAALMRALLKHQVLLVRGQRLSERDLSHIRQRLGQANLLHAPAAAATGTKHSFGSLYAIYDALPPSLRKRIAHLEVGYPDCDDDDIGE